MCRPRPLSLPAACTQEDRFNEYLASTMLEWDINESKGYLLGEGAPWPLP